MEHELNEQKNNVDFYKNILQATTEQYLCIFIYDLQEGTIFDVKNDMNYKLSSNSLSLQQMIYNHIEKFSSLEYVPKMKFFSDLSTLEKRFDDKKVISKIFLGKDHSWCNTKFIRMNNETPIRYVMCIIERVDDQILHFEEQRKELKENKKLHSMISAFMEEYNTVCNVNLETKKIEFSQLSERLVGSYLAASRIRLADEVASMYIDMAIHEKDKEEVKKILTKKFVEENIDIGKSSTFVYRNELGKYFEMRIFRTSKDNVFLGFKDKSPEMEEIQNIIYTDSLTGVKNRKYYDEQVSEEISEAVVICDIDLFKKYNDTYGHQFGDKVIYCVAKALKESLRNSDDVIRYGGDEFVVTFTKITIEALQALLTKMKCAIENITFDEYPEVHLSMSFGAAYGKGKTYQMLAKADEALYNSKKRRNNITINLYEKGISLIKVPKNK